MEEQRQVKEDVGKLFEEMYREQRECRPKLDGVRFKIISLKDNLSLLTKFKEREVKEAVWECGSSKSLGLDDFNFSFIKAFWDFIKGLMDI